MESCLIKSKGIIMILTSSIIMCICAFFQFMRVVYVYVALICASSLIKKKEKWNQRCVNEVIRLIQAHLFAISKHTRFRFSLSLYRFQMSSANSICHPLNYDDNYCSFTILLPHSLPLRFFLRVCFFYVFFRLYFQFCYRNCHYKWNGHFHIPLSAHFRYFVTVLKKPIEF